MTQAQSSYWRTDRPTDVFYSTPLAAQPALTVRTYLPDDYVPRYPYPLLVLFHGHGGNEEQVLRLAPRMSRRNYLAISIRGPEMLGVRPDGKIACGWGGDESVAEMTEEYVVRAVEQTRRTFHVHSERVYFVGVNEGAKAAYRTAFSLSDTVAGVVALNGSLPMPTPGRPMFRLDAIRGLRVMVGHGIANAVTPFSTAERDARLLWSAGADVKLASYAATNRLHPDMLRDVNRWVIGHANAKTDELVLR